MTWLYVFMLAAGAPLLLWFVLGGGDADGGLGGDGDGGGDVFSVIPISTLAMLSTFFGATGLVTRAVGVAPFVTFLVALGVGVLAAAMNSAAFGYLRRTESSSDVSDREVEGSIARVALPISSQQRGRIVLTVAGARTQMTAAPIDVAEPDDVIESGARVIVVRMEAGVALVTRLDPELE